MPLLCWTLSGSPVRDLSGLGDPTSSYANAGVALGFTGACNPSCPPGSWSCLGSFIIKFWDFFNGGRNSYSRHVARDIM